MGFSRPLNVPGFSQSDAGDPADAARAAQVLAASDDLPWQDIASATTTSIGALNTNKARITGTTTITGLGTVGAGVRKLVRFAGILTLTHHATALILPGSADITTAANDTAEFVSLGAGNWICLWYKRASGLLLTSALATAGQSRDTTDTTHALTPANMLDLGALRVLFVLTDADMNVTTDQAFTKRGAFTNWLLQNILFTNSSLSLTTAVGGIYTAAGKTGITMVAASQAYSGAAGANQGISLTPSAAGRGVMTATPIFALSTPQGAAATGDVYILGVPLS